MALDKAIDRLADMIEGGQLLASTDPAAFLQICADRITELEAEVEQSQKAHLRTTNAYADLMIRYRKLRSALDKIVDIEYETIGDLTAKAKRIAEQALGGENDT